VTGPGDADPRLAAALAALRPTPSPAARAEVLAALAGARVYVPVVERRTALPEGGTAPEVVLLTLVGSAGGRALPLFLDAGGAVAFRPGARPVPMQGPQACAAAVEDDAVAVLLDPAGAALALTGGDLRELAAGRVPVAGADLSATRTAEPLAAPDAVDDALLQAAGRALRGEPVRAARLLAGPDGPVLGIVPTGRLDAAALTALAGRVLPRVGRADLAVTAVPPEGPGLPVPLRRGWRDRLTGADGR
jgi:hypothetical protein